MSSSCIGPFGRVLPAFKSLPVFPDCVWEVSDRPSKLSSPRQLPSPKRPVGLEFGTDTALKLPTQSARCEPMLSPDPSSPPKDEESPSNLEQLPSERQLLTPSSPSSLPRSPQFPHTRPNYSPGVTSAQLFPPMDSTYDSPNVISLFHNHGFTDHIATAVPTMGTPPPVSNALYGQYYPQIGGHAPPITPLGIQLDQQDFLPHEPRSYTPPDVEYPISHYHQGQLPYHPNLLNNTETPPSSNPADAIGDGLQPSAIPVLPHVVDEQVVEGEGPCYIYSDGSYCPKLIEGEPVNANWGVTKAGKPRKRLAQACITCREKKIKCHPNLPKCDQCQKSGRMCRFESAPRGNQTAKKSQSHRKTRTTSPKDGLVANSPNHQYPRQRAATTTTISSSYPYPRPTSLSESPISLSPVSDRPLSLFSSSSMEELSAPNNFTELGRPPKRRK